MDNDYVRGSSLFKVLEKVIDKMDSQGCKSVEIEPIPTQDLHILSPDMEVVEFVGEPLVVLGNNNK